MFKTIRGPGTGTVSSTPEHHEIDLTSLDYQSLTPEQWTLVKRQVARRGQVERVKAVRAILNRLILWRGERPGGASPHPDLTASVSA